MKSFWDGFEKRAAAMKEVACIAVFDDGTQQMLMGKRRDNSSWTNPGGHLESGEDPRAGALRELHEETGIALSDRDLAPVGSKVVTKPDGTKIKVYGFKAELDEKAKTTLRNDPDKEVSSWRWIPTKDGLPGYVANNLHVPLNDNVLLGGLGIKAQHEKTAFWQGFKGRAKGDLIPGGLADSKTDKDFPAEKIRQGAKVEREHSSSPAIAREISRDHLAEDVDYYDKLKSVEK